MTLILALSIGLSSSVAPNDDGFLTITKTFIARSGSTIVEVGVLGESTNKEIWIVPDLVVGKEGMSLEPGTRIAADFRETALIGESPRNGEFLVCAKPAKGTRGQVSAFDLSGKLKYTVDAFTGDVHNACVSRDGRTLVASQTIGEEGQSDVWVLDLESWLRNPKATTALRLTNDAAVEHHLLVSENGAHASWVTGFGPSEMIVKSVPGGDTIAVKSARQIEPRAYSPGGGLFYEESSVAGGQVWSKIGWLQFSTKSSRTFIEYQNIGTGPLRPLLNADGSVMSITVPRVSKEHGYTVGDAMKPVFFRLVYDRDIPLLRAIFTGNGVSEDVFVPSAVLTRSNEWFSDFNLLPAPKTHVTVLPSAVDIQLGYGNVLSVAWSPNDPSRVSFATGLYQEVELPPRWIKYPWLVQSTVETTTIYPRERDSFNESMIGHPILAKAPISFLRGVAAN